MLTERFALTQDAPLAFAENEPAMIVVKNTFVEMKEPPCAFEDMRQRSEPVNFKPLPCWEPADSPSPSQLSTDVSTDVSEDEHASGGARGRGMDGKPSLAAAIQRIEEASSAPAAEPDAE